MHRGWLLCSCTEIGGLVHSQSLLWYIYIFPDKVTLLGHVCASPPAVIASSSAPPVQADMSE